MKLEEVLAKHPVATRTSFNPRTLTRVSFTAFSRDEVYRATIKGAVVVEHREALPIEYLGYQDWEPDLDFGLSGLGAGLGFWVIDEGD